MFFFYNRSEMSVFYLIWTDATNVIKTDQMIDPVRVIGSMAGDRSLVGPQDP